MRKFKEVPNLTRFYVTVKTFSKWFDEVPTVLRFKNQLWHNALYNITSNLLFTSENEINRLKIG